MFSQRDIMGCCNQSEAEEEKQIIKYDMINAYDCSSNQVRAIRPAQAAAASLGPTIKFLKLKKAAD